MSLGRSVEAERGSAAVRVVTGLLVAALIAVVAMFGCGWWLMHAMRTSLPQLDGTIHLSGLTATVAVRRDQHGVPHIQAANLDDLLFAQGYVTAQDRLWELDMARRMTAGDAAEILGPKLMEHDRMQRVLALRATAEQMTAELDDQDRRYMEDYARGVNAYIQSHEDRLPAEFRLLMYQPQPWTPADSITVALGMVQMLDEHWPEKIERERITAKLGPTLAADLYPSTTWRDHPVISSQPPISAPDQVIPDVPLDHSQTGSSASVQGSGAGGPRPAFPLMASLAANWLTPQEASDPWTEVVNGSPAECLGCDPGSNEWAVSGARTASGHAMLSNDMHLQHQIPNIWYEIDMEAPGFHAAGLSVPGLPMVVAGHNEHIAWGFTALYGDTQDIYVEKINAQGEYLGTDGAWHPMEHAVETIRVRGERNVTVDVERTDHGVVITPLIPGEKRTLALDWTIYSPAAHGLPLLAMDTAANWTDFRQALSQWWAPTQNVVYADDQGNIGYQAVGLMPLRPNGLEGVPITDNTHAWQGFIPFDDLPSSYNPPDGLLATANSRVTPQNDPYPLTLEWGEPFRNERIWKWLAPKTQLTEKDMLTLQTDVYSEVDQEIAQRLAYGIDHADHAGKQLRQAANLLRTWDGVVSIDSAPAAIVAAAKQAFYPMVLQPKLGNEWKRYRWGESIYAGEQILMNENPAWLPPKYPSWNDFLADLVRQGLAMDGAPPDLSRWRYGYAHPVDVEHPIFGLLPWFKAWTGTGARPQSGDTTTVKQVARTFGPSQRFTIDWGNLDTATENIVMGESGNPLSPYYRDQWSYWYHGRTFTLPFTEQAVAAATVHTLRLKP
jgi:penicillin G amidase